MIALTLLTTFWITPASFERLGLLLIIILVNMMYLHYVYNTIPPNGDDIPLVVLYYRDSLIMIVIALLWTILSRFLASTTRSTDIPLPSFVLQFLDSWPSKILCLESRSHQKSTNNSLNIQKDWTWLAHLLDRFVFFIYLLTYIIFIFAFL